MSRRSVAGSLGRLAAACVLGGGLTLVAPAGAATAVEDGQWWQIQWRMDEVRPIADGSGVTVAVLDSGVDASVSELSDAVIPGADFTGLGGDGMTDFDDEEGGHGTGMASFIAARDVGTGVVGVAPGATILPITTGRGPMAETAETLYEMYDLAIRYATDQGAQVINISFGAAGPLGCPARVAQAVHYAVSEDVVVVASHGADSNGDTNWPASCPGVLTVAANDSQLEPWTESHQSEYVDVSAPGVQLSSVRPGGEYGYSTGVSNSSALVSGAVALIRSQFPEASAREVVERIIATTRDVGPSGWDDVSGYGVVVPYRALTEEVPPDTPNPVFDALGDLSEEKEPGPSGPPALGEPDLLPPMDQRGPPAGLLLGAGLAFAFLVAVAAVVIVLLVVRSRRRQRYGRLPGPPPPPGSGDPAE